MESGEPKKFKFSVGYVILAFWIALLLQQVLTIYLHPDKLPYSDFKQAVAAGKVDDVAIGATNIHGHFKNEDGAGAPTSQPIAPPPPPPPVRGHALAPRAQARVFDTVRVEDPQLLGDLQQHGVRVTGVVESTFWRDAMSWLLPIALMVAFWGLIARRAGQGGHNGFMTVGRSK